PHASHTSLSCAATGEVDHVMPLGHEPVDERPTEKSRPAGDDHFHSWPAVVGTPPSYTVAAAAYDGERCLRSSRCCSPPMSVSRCWSRCRRCGSSCSSCRPGDGPT